jgi:hypothetical protein
MVAPLFTELVTEAAMAPVIPSLRLRVVVPLIGMLLVGLGRQGEISAGESDGPALLAPAPSPLIPEAKPQATTAAEAVMPLPLPVKPLGENLPASFTPPTSSLMLPADSSPVRSEQLEGIAQQADRQVRRGFDLANRGALFAARAEFVAALRMIADGLDTERQTTVHGRALAAGLTALREAQDFMPIGARLEAELDVPTIVAAHRTPVLKGCGEKARAWDAVKCYLTFAQEQLAAAAGHEVAGSMALCALGKLHAALARQKGLDIAAPEAKAIVFFQASLLVQPRNHLASNELGVLLAQCGKPADARPLLEHSVSVCRGATSLGNLAVVYEQLGQTRRAAETRQQAEVVRSVEIARAKAMQSSAGGAVQWVGPEVLAQTGQPPEVPARSPAAGPGTPAVQQPPPESKKPVLSLLPWSQDKPVTR